MYFGNPVDVMALIFLIAATIKLVTILVSPKAWAGVVSKVWKRPILVMIVSLILAYASLSYLLSEITIIQLFAAMLFTVFLAAIGMSAYSKDVVSLAQKLLKDKSIIKKSWLFIIIWVLLIIWGFYVLFFYFLFF